MMKETFSKWIKRKWTHKWSKTLKEFIYHPATEGIPAMTAFMVGSWLFGAILYVTYNSILIGVLGGLGVAIPSLIIFLHAVYRDEKKQYERSHR